MSAKNRDNKNRWRNITVGFRVSSEENELINRAVALSGLPKQEYCYRRCLNQKRRCGKNRPNLCLKRLRIRFFRKVTDGKELLRNFAKGLRWI